MSFTKKTWKDRQTEHPTRRTLVAVSGQSNVYDVARTEGTVTQEGDNFSASNMNDLENRIQQAVTLTEYVNIPISGTPTTFSGTRPWDTDKRYKYRLSITVTGLGANDVIENIVIPVNVMDTLAPYAETGNNSLTLYFETNSAVSSQIISLIVRK